MQLDKPSLISYNGKQSQKEGIRMSMNQIRNFLYKYGIYVLYAFFIFLCAYVCFARLDAGLLQHWDEARHGVNAYEMMKDHNYIVNTYNYENDYFNLKPPLSYWGIILGFKLFGVNAFGLRFYSALAMFLTFLVIAFYLHKRHGRLAALTSMMLFLTCYDLFYWHAGRNADADAVYILFFTIGCLCLMESLLQPRLIYVCGLMFSLGFLAKSWHACVLLPIGGLFFLFSGLLKKLKLHHYVLFLLCALGPIALWAVIRYQYDGMAFLGQMFGVDVTQRISWSESSNPDYFFFLNYLMHSRAILVMLGTLLFCALFLLLQKFFMKQKPPAGGLALSPAALTLLLWIFVPFIVFSLSHTYYYWYVYPIFPGLCIAAAIAVEKCRKNCKTSKSFAILGCFLLLPMLAALHYDRITVSEIDDLEVSGFQIDLRTAMEENPDLHGMIIYVEKNDNEYKDSYYWEQGGLLMAELAGDLKCEEGGVEAFLKEAEDALLIVDPFFYNSYKTDLGGLDIIYQNEFMIMRKSNTPLE